MSKLKGWYGERLIRLRLWLSLSKKEYQIYNDLTILTNNGSCQLDHIVVSKYGIFIIETKYRSGWIFGSENGKSWTQVLYRKKYKFQNPLHQLYRQKMILTTFLNLTSDNFHPIVVFKGRCTLKTDMPDNVMKSGFIDHIKSYKIQILSDDQLKMSHMMLGSFKKYGTVSKKAHISSLHDRHNSKTNCPKCGGFLLVRTAFKNTPNEKQFLGCRNFPSCRFTTNI
jgi:restriction system protein